MFSVIRNGIANGYPFVEAYGCWLDTCSRLVIVDGGSADGTRVALGELASIDSRVEVHERAWPAAATGGSAIAQLTDTALALSRAAGRRLMYVQADEVFDAEQRRLVASFSGKALRFAGCVNFWNSFDTVLENEFPMRYIRLLPADTTARSVGDGYTFEVSDADVVDVPQRILHYGWCFPVNILRKHVSHGGLYSDSPAYALRARLAKLMLSRGRYDRALLDALSPQYRPVPWRGVHPPCMSHLLALPAYDPNPGLDRLEAGERW